MKVAISGKGGVGKTTICAMMASALSLRNRAVIALDADPDANLAAALGVPVADHPIALSEMGDMIADRTGSKDGYGGYFKLNPKVDDIPEKYSLRVQNVRLLVLGGVKEGGAGCICPATALIKALLSYLILSGDESIIMDMEAGIEHLGRATAQSMDALVIVVDENPWSIQTARRIRKLAGNLGMSKLFAIVNRVEESTDLTRIARELEDIPIIGEIPYDARLRAGIVQMTQQGAMEPLEGFSEHLDAVEKILSQLDNTL